MYIRIYRGKSVWSGEIATPSQQPDWTTEHMASQIIKNGSVTLKGVRAQTHPVVSMDFFEVTHHEV